MKRIAAVILTLVLFPAISSAAQEAGSRVYVVSGDVFVTQGKNPAHRVTNSEPVVPDTLVNTGDNSAALLKFEDGQVVTMQANSTFQVREYRYDAMQVENSNIVFLLAKGGTHFITGQIGQQNNQAFKLLTSSSTIRIRGTDFMVVKAGNSIYSQVLDGSISMSNAAGTTVLEAGQSAVVASPTVLASLDSASAIPLGTFSALLSIPVNPSAITASAPVAVQGPVAGAAPHPADALAATPAKVEEQNKTGADGKSAMGLTGKAGTLGYGAELNFGISDSVSSRVGLNAYTYKLNANSSLLNFNFKWQLQTASALVDWYPFSGSFRSSVGLLYNNNKVSLTAKPIGGSFVINGVSYSTAQIGSLKGTMSFNKAAPYIGLGWGNPLAKGKGWGLVTDFGVLAQGKPKVDLVVTCTDPLICAQLQTDAAAESTKLEKDLRHFRWWPVASVGVSYQW